MQELWIGLIFGLIVGWLVEWIIDWRYWRRKHGSLARRKCRVETPVGGRRTKRRSAYAESGNWQCVNSRRDPLTYV